MGGGVGGGGGGLGVGRMRRRFKGVGIGRGERVASPSVTAFPHLRLTPHAARLLSSAYIYPSVFPLARPGLAWSFSRP